MDMNDKKGRRNRIGIKNITHTGDGYPSCALFGFNSDTINRRWKVRWKEYSEIILQEIMLLKGPTTVERWTFFRKNYKNVQLG